jgi:uncharacterized protein YuzE
MNIKYDKIADAVYMKMSESRVANTVKLDDTFLVDKDEKGNIVGFEILDASSRTGFIQNLEEGVLEGIPVSIITGTPVVA